ncbi:MAG TPA: SLC13 family permease [Polyangiaceae bacterium]|jgi:Na+/H+ antiporter NhaD/arsenite permease-like protein
MLVVATWIIFAVTYGVLAIGHLPGTKVDRSAMAFIGAVAALAVGAIDWAHAARAIDARTLVVLFSMMVVVAVLHLDGLFEWISGHVVARLDRRHLLPGVVFTSGILSAFLVNDVVCLFMTPLVLRIVEKTGRKPLPFLLALATASNIGSAATLTGNPQNILIGSVSHIGYRDFFVHLGPVALAGLFVDWAVIAIVCRSDLAATSEPKRVAPSETDRESPLAAVIVAAAIVVLFLAGLDPALVAAGGAAVLFVARSRKLRAIYAEVDLSLLVLFVGLFVVVGALEQTGIARTLLGAAEKLDLHRLAIFSAVVALLSNVVSNVPAVMLFKNVVPDLGRPHELWLALAMASTLAGNLTITGSIANLIVAQRARPIARIGFRDYLRVGVPTTLVTIALGAGWLSLVEH